MAVSQMEILNHFKTHTLPFGVRFQPWPQHFGSPEDRLNTFP